ncbi:uncharacterized protein EAF02_009993 [Botrytis sinoallii]|uniref:uncharacterized protein n=1 Tax=Botrytis sinoallii TaxID=1463999 RepID=UPI0019001455|nr:uncharacterized protein EAF02_009993 [Botrytis sinoallii]KAF7865570.1 hypothetical protein EAF02_009993 [Botrytis sinoallii]
MLRIGIIFHPSQAEEEEDIIAMNTNYNNEIRRDPHKLFSPNSRTEANNHCPTIATRINLELLYQQSQRRQNEQTTYPKNAPISAVDHSFPSFTLVSCISVQSLQFSRHAMDTPLATITMDSSMSLAQQGESPVYPGPPLVIVASLLFPG